MDEYMTVQEIAKELKFDDSTIRKWIYEGRLKADKCGPRTWRIKRKDYIEFKGEL
jgi:excisionase family DNA binding protein